MTAAGSFHSEVDLSTYSVTGVDLERGEWGVAIASRFLAVGALSRFAETGVGVVVIQANLSVDNGQRAMSMLREGVAATDVVERVLEGDFNRRRRQMAVIDHAGAITCFTGEDCNHWAGGKVGNGCVALGNTLAGPHVCAAMVQAFEGSPGSLAQRLVAALSAGEAAGGDKRGKQSAALLVVRPGADRPLNVFSNRTVDLRVDDHQTPCRELLRLHLTYDLLYDRPSESDLVEPSEPVLARLQGSLRDLGLYMGVVDGRLGGSTREAIKTALERLGLDAAVDPDAPRLDRRFVDLIGLTTRERVAP